jgi:hypothetical protein
MYFVYENFFWNILYPVIGMFNIKSFFSFCKEGLIRCDIWILHPVCDRAITQAVIRRLLTTAAQVRAQVMQCGVFSEYFGFPCQFSFHRLLQIHHLSSGAGTTRQLVADVPSGLSLTQPQETKKDYRFAHIFRQLRLSACWFCGWLTFRPKKWTQYILLKSQWTTVPGITVSFFSLSIRVSSI